MTTTQKTQTVYRTNDKPPRVLLVFSAIQHVLLILSAGLALPVTISRTAGLSLTDSGIFMSIALLSIGITTILQTVKCKYIGSGLQSMSGADGAALSACTMAAAAGGLPLVYGMTIFSGGLKVLLGSFTYRMRKLFPPEVTGSMIFILGISIIGTSVGYFTGVAYYEPYRYAHLLVAVVSLLTMLGCTIFFKKLKSYAVLIGAAVGTVLSFIVGVADTASFAALSQDPLVRLPILKEFHIDFDVTLMIPFLVVTAASLIDNIGDYSALQKLDNKKGKIDWRCIENGVRSSGLGSLMAGCMGGVIQSTATTNIGVAGATGVTSRVVAYATAGILIVLSFFPRVMGALMLIPIPVLGAMLLFSVCFIMAGGFSTLSSRELDDRKIFVVFLSIIFSISTLMPNLWSFLPEAVAKVIVSPMVMGILVLIPMTLLVRIGNKKTAHFPLDGTTNTETLNADIKKACQLWGAPREVCSKLQVALDAVAEGIYFSKGARSCTVDVSYDEIELVIHIVASGLEGLSMAQQEEDDPAELDVALIILRHMCDEVKVSYEDNCFDVRANMDL